jgi:hypothetical protein
VSRAKQLDPPSNPGQQAKRRSPQLLSSLLFLVAIGFAAVALYMYWDETQNKKNDPTPPPAAAGEYTLAQVKTALDAQGLKTDFGRSSGHADQIPGVPGQYITIGDADVYIYVFSSSNGPEAAIQAAADAFAQIDESTIVLTRQSGDVIDPDKPKHVFLGSNIIAVMVGGSDANVQKVKTAIEGLP